MPIHIVCPSCGAQCKAPDNAAGRTFKCPHCSGFLKIPTSLDKGTTRLEPAGDAPGRRTADNEPGPFGKGTTRLETFPPDKEAPEPVSAQALPQRFANAKLTTLRNTPLPPPSHELSEAASPVSPANALKRFLSLPWVAAIIVLGFLPWSEVACNSKEINWRATQSGYQTVYGGIGSPFDIVEVAKKAASKELADKPEALSKSIEVERSGFLMSYSPFMMFFWMMVLAVVLFICLMPLSKVRLTFCVAFAGMMLVTLVIQSILGTPLESRINHKVTESIKDNPQEAMKLALTITSGKTVWFWLVLTAVFLFGSTELLTNLLWDSYITISSTIPAVITFFAGLIGIAGVGTQVVLWQSKIADIESRLAEYRDKERKKAEQARALALAEQRRQDKIREDAAEEIRKAKSAEEKRKAEEKLRQIIQEAEARRREAEEMRIAEAKRKAQEEATKIQERERQEKSEQARKERERLDTLSEKDMKEIRSLLEIADNTDAVQFGLSAVIRLGPKAADALPELLQLLKDMAPKKPTFWEPTAPSTRVLQALKSIGPAAKSALLQELKDLPAAQQAPKLEVALWLAVIDAKDVRVKDAISPILVRELRPKTNTDEPSEEVMKAITAIGKPIDVELLKALEAADGGGVINAHNRKALFLAFQRLGKEAYSEATVSILRRYQRKEMYRDVQEAAGTAISAMLR